MTKIEQMIEQARTQLLYVQPFYALMLQKCRLNLTEKVKTAGVRILPTGQVELAIAPSFFEGLSEEHRIGLLQHEMLHLFMNHISRGKGLDKKVGNVAMDIAINQFIAEKHLPEGGCTPEKFNLPKNREFEFYYSELLKKEDKNENQQQNKQGMSGQDEQSQGQDESQQQDKQDDQSQEKDDQSQGGQQDSEQPSDENQGQSGGQNEQQGDGSFDNHEWNEQEGGCQEIQELVVAQMAKECQSEMRARFAGKMPQQIDNLIERVLGKKAKVDWKSELRKFVGRNLSQDRESTRTRPNRRMGFAAQGYKREYTPKVTIALDQSGSMGEPEIQACFQEIRGLLKNQEDSTEVVYFDTEISKVETLRKEVESRRYSSGGTDFNCVVDHLVKSHSDLCIIMTDGVASQPKKSKTPILWMIVSQEKNPKINLDGPKIFVDLE